MKEVVKEKSISSHYIAMLLDSLAQHGKNADPLLKQFGFTSEQFKADNLSTVPNRLPYQLGVSLARYIWKQLGDENLGLSEKVLPTGGFAYAGRLAVSAHNLGEAIELMIGFFNYIDAGVKVSNQQINNDFELTFKIQAKDEGATAILADYTVSGFHRFFCWLIDKKIILKSASFNFPLPEANHDYGAIYQCPKTFNRDRLAIRFNKKYLQSPVERSVDDFSEFVSQAPKHILLNDVEDNSYTQQVKKIVETYKGKELPKFDDIAAQMNMVPKTLRLHLRTEGITYQKIKDVMRHDWAIHYLNQPHYSLASIAEKVGFTEQGAFARAFKCWTNITPGAYRKALFPE